MATLAAPPELLGELNASDPRKDVLHLEPPPPKFVADADLPDVAAAVADVADLKSPCFHDHARRVAHLATATGERLRLAAEDLRRMHIAALLQDIGRVAVSDRIWEKPERLSRVDWEQVRLHAYHSERVLASSEALRPIATLAGMRCISISPANLSTPCGPRSLRWPEAAPQFEA